MSEQHVYQPVHPWPGGTIGIGSGLCQYPGCTEPRQSTVHGALGLGIIRVPQATFDTMWGSGSPVKFMPPGHFCPDVCGIEDFGDADTWRGRVVRGFFRLMTHWPKPKGTP